jgi:hypothetical protein
MPGPKKYPDDPQAPGGIFRHPPLARRGVCSCRCGVMFGYDSFSNASRPVWASAVRAWRSAGYLRTGAVVG